MENENFNGLEINMALISRLMKNWPKRASVRGCYFDEFKDNDNNYDSSLPDYPISLVPFWTHPNFEKVDDEIKFKILTWGWINYNTRTIHAEEKIVNPSFELIIQDTFKGTSSIEMKSVVHQSLIDERFHSYMHFNAMNVTKSIRKINEEIDLPVSITYRYLVRHQSREPESWKQKMMILACGIVSETSINAYLSLLSKSKDVQPKHTLVSKLHDIDEYAHSSLLVEIAKAAFINFSKNERQFFVKYLPKAMDAFCAQDYSAWAAILNHYKISGTEKIIADCENEAVKAKLVNDYSGLKKVAEELNIDREIDFDFN